MAFFQVDVRSENAKKFRDMFDKGQVPEAAALPDKAAQVITVASKLTFEAVV